MIMGSLDVLPGLHSRLLAPPLWIRRPPEMIEVHGFLLLVACKLFLETQILVKKYHVDQSNKLDILPRMMLYGTPSLLRVTNSEVLHYSWCVRMAAA
jgi:hypothetical protein